MKMQNKLGKTVGLSIAVAAIGLAGPAFADDLNPAPESAATEQIPVKQPDKGVIQGGDEAAPPKVDAAISMVEEPVQALPLQDVPMQELPLENDPLMESPLEQQQIEEGVESAPLHEAPVRDEGLMQMSAPLENAPIQEVPTQEFPAE